MDDLQPELITQILQKANLSPVELCRLCELNRDWREAVGAGSCGKRLNSGPRTTTRERSSRISKYCGSLTELRVVRARREPQRPQHSVQVSTEHSAQCTAHRMPKRSLEPPLQQVSR